MIKRQFKVKKSLSYTAKIEFYIAYMQILVGEDTFKFNMSINNLRNDWNFCLFDIQLHSTQMAENGWIQSCLINRRAVVLRVSSHVTVLHIYIQHPEVHNNCSQITPCWAQYATKLFFLFDIFKLLSDSALILSSQGLLFLPPDWLVIVVTIMAVAAVLLVCAVVARRNRYDFSCLTPSHPISLSYCAQ